MSGAGYGGLLNLEARRHCTIFVSDFALPPVAVVRLRRQLENCPTRLLFVRIDRGVAAVRRELRAAGVDRRRDYLSFHGVVARYDSISLLDDLLDSSPRGDLARIDLPFRECGFHPRFATHAIRVVTEADYKEQNRVSSRFFKILGSTSYNVSIRTSGGVLDIADQVSWFDLAGPLRERETRTLPGGEVAYTGSRISGTFVADGAILASPEEPAAAAEALRLTRLSRELKNDPLRLRISDGTVVNVGGDGRAARTINRLLEQEERYRAVTEAGISFNRACSRFIHSWPAASNEGRPGVHLALGGDPDRRDEPAASSPPIVHIDFMSANAEVVVNGHPFLRAQS